MSETCEHEGCTAEAVVNGYIAAADGEPETVEHLCVDHAIQHGYCYVCGNFWAGVEAYDFSRIPGVCPNCIDEFDDDWEEDEDGGLTNDPYYFDEEYADDALDVEAE